MIPSNRMLEILTMDQLRAVLDQLEKIEIEAIGIMAHLRNHHQMPDYFCDYCNILVEIQIKIRDFRVILSKNSGGWNGRFYQEFLDYASSALDHCNRAAMQMYPVYQQNGM